MNRTLHEPDLFGEAGPSGLAIAAAIVTPDEERALIAAIDAAELAPFRFHGWFGKRLTRSYGWAYDFGDASLAPAAPIPEWLLPLRERAARFARVPADELVQALLIRYDPGAGIGWHRDRRVFEHVLGVSLGTETAMRLRRRRAGGFERAAAWLAPRSIYHLAGEVRHQWEHSIAPLGERRCSVTFRSLSETGRRVARAAGRDQT